MATQKEKPQAIDSLTQLAQEISEFLNKNNSANLETTQFDNKKKLSHIINILVTVVAVCTENGSRLSKVKEQIQPLLTNSGKYFTLQIDGLDNFKLVSNFNEIRSLLGQLLSIIAQASLDMPIQESLSATTEDLTSAFPEVITSTILRLLADGTTTSEQLAEALRAQLAQERTAAEQISRLHQTIQEYEKQILRDKQEAAEETAKRRDQELNDQIYALKRERGYDKTMLNIKLGAERRKARRELFEEMDITLVVNLLEKYDLFIDNPETEDINLGLDKAFVQILAMRAFSLKTTLAGKLKDKIKNLVRDGINPGLIDSLFDQAEKWIEVRSSQSDQ